MGPEGITLQCDATNWKLRDVYSHFASLNSPTGHSYLSVPALALVDEICPDVSDVEVEDEVVAVTEDETEAGSDSCYALVANTVAFPLWDQICPELNPLPDVCGVLDISTDLNHVVAEYKCHLKKAFSPKVRHDGSIAC